LTLQFFSRISSNPALKIARKLRESHVTILMLMLMLCGCANRLLTSTITMKPTSTSQRENVISLLLSGHSTRQVESKTGLGKSTIARINKELVGAKENCKAGRPSKLSARDRRIITQQITTGQLDNAVQVTQYINNIIPKPVCSQTVRNALKQEHFRAVVKAKKPLLKKIHRENRLKFAQYHANWTVEDWKRVLWSDETKINRIGSDGCSYVWKKKGEPLSDRTTTPTVKHGGGNNLMVWGCMGWNGVGVLTEVQGIMNADQYVDILGHGVGQSMENLEMDLDTAIFQQDNDPKHTSKKADKWFEDNQIHLMVWPAQSPDLNPIEHLWDHLKRQLNKYPKPPSGCHELWERVAEEWNNIPPETCQGLIESMPRRIKAVLSAKGGHTKY
jgi:transposase